MKPTVIWITGLSGAGKSTIASALFNLLKEKNYRVALADSDTLRLHSKTPIGFDIESRWRAVHAMIYAVRNMIEFQKAEIVVVTSISPLKEMRASARNILTKYCGARFIEMFMDTPVEICESRDPKCLYKKFRAGLIKDMSGIDSPYEPPQDAEIIIYPESTSDKTGIDITVKLIYNYLYE